MSATKLQWFYTDSGHPGVDNYDTVILIHGMNWHEESFHPMYPFAAPAGLRFVSFNRRGYPGTTPYSAEEQALLTSSDTASHLLFHRQQGLAVARIVLEILADPKLALPESGKVGVLGWSTGNWFVLALMSALDHPELLPAERDTLSKRITHAILGEPPSAHMGAHPPANGYNPAAEPVPDLLEIARWASGYFDHPDLASRDSSRLEFRKYLSDPSPAVDRLTAEEIARMSLNAGPIDGPFLLPEWREANELATREALRKVKDGLWPRVKDISIIWGDKTFWLIPPGLWALEDYAKELGGPPLDIKLLKGGNHFMILDHAKETTAFVKEFISA
ncbi:alpha/beta-hydrolase [Exidia glandulosa HHB12029]|uniref:Alpha/beta-hydrolase n=1 Tax=Exidia glandulosa HHB12029 TaxID=1314781 RepID=A0A165HXU5_EXIGL|nr:alpha/beta-hydrolase [Exidia glandulosa HHB12029]